MLEWWIQVTLLSDIREIVLYTPLRRHPGHVPGTIDFLWIPSDSAAAARDFE